MAEKFYHFRWKKLRPKIDDYGWAVGMICNHCEDQVTRASHAGRPVDEGYFWLMMTDIGKEHLEAKHPEVLGG